MMMQVETYGLFLVDSRSMFRQGLRALLRKYSDLTVVGEAADEATAVQQIRGLRPDVVVVGNHASGPDALALTSTLRREAPDSNVILLTANGEDPNFIFQAVRAGARGCISQDSDVEDLAKAIRLVAQGQAVLAPQSLTSLIDLITQPETGADAPRGVDRLTARERDVLYLVAHGFTNRVIAEHLCVSESTIRCHIHNILDKLQLANRVQAAAFALTTGKLDRAWSKREPQVPRWGFGN